MATITWKINDLERQLDDDRVFTVHYSVAATQGNQKAELYGAVGLEGFVTIPYEDLTEPMVIEWVKGRIGSDEIQRMLLSIESELEQQLAPKTSTGVPW